MNCQGIWDTVLEIEPGGSMSDLTGPAVIAIRKLDRGEHLVVVSELFAHDATRGEEDVPVVMLPASFDTARNWWGCPRHFAALHDSLRPQIR